MVKHKMRYDLNVHITKTQKHTAQKQGEIKKDNFCIVLYLSVSHSSSYYIIEFLGKL